MSFDLLPLHFEERSLFVNALVEVVVYLAEGHLSLFPSEVDAAALLSYSSVKVFTSKAFTSTANAATSSPYLLFVLYRIYAVRRVFADNTVGHPLPSGVNAQTFLS